MVYIPISQTRTSAEHEITLDVLFRYFMERWPSGRRRSPAKGVYVISVSRVRIPLSPPETQLQVTSDKSQEKNTLKQIINIAYNL